MRRLLSDRRHGHLFQNRYKSIIWEEDPYFKELVRYIHLNPLRANIVENLAKLDRYRYCGHSVKNEDLTFFVSLTGKSGGTNGGERLAHRNAWTGWLSKN
jgi:hypothetical protein